MLSNHGTRGVFPWQARVKVVIDAATGLEFLHGKGFVHSDIKLNNILLDDQGLAHLADCGLARQSESEFIFTNTSPADTIGFMDPECLRTNTLTKASDLFSLGSVLSCLLKGCLKPIEARINAKRLSDGEVGVDSLDSCASWPHEKAFKAAGIATQCCDRHPEERPSGTEALLTLCQVLVAGEDGAPESFEVATVSGASDPPDAGSPRLCTIC